MDKIGIVGGIGPASTLDYYREIISGFRSATGGKNYPKIIVNSVDMTEMLRFTEKKDFPGLTDFLLRAIGELASAGATFALIASNTPHIVFDQVRERSPLPMISIVEAACARAMSLRLKKLLLIGTGFTMANHFYQDALALRGIECFVPSEDGQALIQNIIFPELEDGIVRPEQKARLVGLCANLIRDEGADGIILGCTELPLMIGERDFDVAVLNTTRIHIDVAIERLIAEL